MATSIQSQDVARDIYPIFEVDPNPDGKGPMAVGFRGTGFLLAPNLFMTCWHCLESPVADGNQLALVGSLPEAKFRASPLGEIGRDENGLDLATARVAATPSLPFSFPDRPPDYGADVAAFGYPLTETPTNDRPSFKTHPRYLRGYIIRDFMYEGPDGEVLSYELDMPAPAGLSGAPLVLAGTRHLIGVVYGQNEVGLIDRFASIDDEGNRVSEVQQVQSFALAHHASVLLDHRSRATGGIEVAKLMGSPKPSLVEGPRIARPSLI
jgi:hypothetical protein